jgi:predicted  nucleic acid-binding Zn-ribbon protein
MRRHFKCKRCGHEFDEFSNRTIYNCPLCIISSYNTAVESWADISYFSFDQDIQISIDNGSFFNAFEYELE